MQHTFANVQGRLPPGFHAGVARENSSQVYNPAAGAATHEFFASSASERDAWVRAVQCAALTTDGVAAVQVRRKMTRAHEDGRKHTVALGKCRSTRVQRG